MYFTPDLKKNLQKELFAAVERRSLARIRRLILSGQVDIAAVDDKDRTVLSLICDNLSMFIEQCVHVDEVHEIIKLAATPETICRKSGFDSSPLYKLALRTEDYTEAIFRSLAEMAYSASLADKLRFYQAMRDILESIRGNRDARLQARVANLNIILTSLFTDENLQELQAGLVSAKIVAEQSKQNQPVVTPTNALEAEIDDTKQKLAKLQSTLEALSKIGPIALLPLELLLNILQYLSLKDLTRLSRTSKTFFDATNHLSLALHAARNRGKLAPILRERRVYNFGQELKDWQPTDQLPEFISSCSEDDRRQLMDILLDNFGYDIKFVSVVDKLLEQTKVNLAEDKSLKDSVTYSISHYLYGLAGTPRAIYCMLRADPTKITLQDENKDTLLHHLASIQYCTRLDGETRPEDRTLAWDLIFLISKPDFNLKNADGDTAVHKLIRECSHKSVHAKFQDRLKRIADSGFDFSIMNNAGQTILHVAAKMFSDSPEVDGISVIIAETIPTIDLDALSTDGNTAFTYLLYNRRYTEALELLKLGANPLLGNAEDMVLSHIAGCKEHERWYPNGRQPNGHPPHGVPVIRNASVELKQLERIKMQIDCYKKNHGCHDLSFDSLSVRRRS